MTDLTPSGTLPPVESKTDANSSWSKEQGKESGRKVRAEARQRKRRQAIIFLFMAGATILMAIACVVVYFIKFG